MIEKGERIMENFNYKNYHVVGGPVVNLFRTPGAVYVTVRTGQGKSYRNYPKVVLLGDMRKEADGLKLGDRIEMECTIQSSRRENKNKPGKKIYSQDLIAFSLKRIPTVLEVAFGTKGGKPVDAKNYAELAGEVVHISKVAPNIVRLTLHTVIDGRNSYISCSKFDYGKQDTTKKISEGDFVVAVGQTQTSKKEKEDSTLHFQTVMITDIKKVS